MCVIKKRKEKEINDERDEYRKEDVRLICVINLRFLEIDGHTGRGNILSATRNPLLGLESGRSLE